MTPAGVRLAAVAAMVAAAQVMAAEPLGKLFFTPEQRAVLERQRQLNLPETRTLDEATVSLDGVVTRSSGRSTVWVNGRPQNENTRDTGVTAAVSPRNPAQAVVTPGEDPAASLKVGESINRATRERTDVLGNGQISVTPGQGAK